MKKTEVILLVHISFTTHFLNKNYFNNIPNDHSSLIALSLTDSSVEPQPSGYYENNYG